MRIGSLFAGIGGFDLAAHWMGWETAWYSEIEPYACKVMQKRFPRAINHGDITQIDGRAIEPVDLLCGGFPCQDISLAGKGAGIDGKRSGLWSHYARLIGELRPRWVVAENVSALRSRGLDRVLSDLAALGYDAEWHCIPASAVGAPHQRDRIWIIAYPTGTVDGCIMAHADSSGPLQPGLSVRLPEGESGGVVPLSAWGGRRRPGADDAAQRTSDQGPADLADPTILGRVEGGALARRSEGRGRAEGDHGLRSGNGGYGTLADAERHGLQGPLYSLAGEGEGDLRRRSADQLWSADWWASEPNVGRVANGVPSRVDRLRCLGNAIVPRNAYILFRAIAAHEA